MNFGLGASLNWSVMNATATEAGLEVVWPWVMVGGAPGGGGGGDEGGRVLSDVGRGV